ncbi:MAG TPA: hypothetical protein VK623_13420 [Flavobacterium sp.]|nr:hypothetical protein [Flavobacterium sp.]
MKKIFLLMLFASGLMVSCSSDDNSPKISTAKATIDGVEYTFNTFSVTQEQFTDETHTYTDVTITASIDSNPDKIFTIIVEKGMTGPSASYYFAYFLDGTAFPKTPSFATDVTTSKNNRVAGSFFGDVMADDGSGDVVTFSNGTFDIYF